MTSTNEIVYDDCYITLTKNTLILKTYYFPFGFSKTIPRGEIDRIWKGNDLDLSFLKKKSWGMALSNIWWACRMGREFDSDNSANFVGSSKQQRGLFAFRWGFSVEDPAAVTPLVNEYIEEA
eukprot:CAMPEP_0194200540 /NCGR_PEP_ID=MMETSP0156-20130528/1102_1 /TAXON_ID=33649 /ORGANISM="Thalassionema nitzschioides, Strain L26-B" /LENGTH=121 /DNA_ID=CAMNT_0038925549 /DNA_START=190 /DNA_END=555 /DNA_ORIENTATION=+